MIKAKKSLGQNFLIDKNILEKITNTTKITNKIVLEVGPGTGNLTSYILKKNPKKLFVIEKDNQLAIDLEWRFNYQISICNWKLNIRKICDIKPQSFFPKPNVDSSLLFFYPKKNFIKINNPNNLEKVTRIFFNQRRKMLKKPFNQLFNGNQNVLNKLKIDLNLRPQNLSLDTYYKLTSEYEKLGS